MNNTENNKKLIYFNPIVLITNTFNKNGTSITLKKQKLSDWIKEQDLPPYCLQEIHSKYSYTYVKSIRMSPGRCGSVG